MTPTPAELAAIQRSGAKDCCKDPANLIRSEPSPGLTINTCAVCGCNHYRVKAERGILRDARRTNYLG